MSDWPLAKINRRSPPDGETDVHPPCRIDRQPISDFSKIVTKSQKLKLLGEPLVRKNEVCRHPEAMNSSRSFAFVSFAPEIFVAHQWLRRSPVRCFRALVLRTEHS
jgi:hypothetical protein